MLLIGDFIFPNGQIIHPRALTRYMDSIIYIVLAILLVREIRKS